MLQDGLAEAAIAGMAKNPAPNRDFASWVNGLRSVPPLYQHALVYSVVADSAEAFEIRVTECLWAKMFREENAADIGYAGICHPDYAAARGFNPKIKPHPLEDADARERLLQLPVRRGGVAASDRGA